MQNTLVKAMHRKILFVKDNRASLKYRLKAFIDLDAVTLLVL